MHMPFSIAYRGQIVWMGMTLIAPGVVKSVEVWPSPENTVDVDVLRLAKNACVHVSDALGLGLPLSDQCAAFLDVQAAARLAGRELSEGDWFTLDFIIGLLRKQTRISQALKESFELVGRAAGRAGA